MAQAPPAAPTDERPASWEDVITAFAKKEGVSPTLALAVARQESGFRPDAVSPKGARGLMQLMPQTAKELGVNIDDPYDNIRGGLRYLKQQIDRYDGNVELGLAAYNAGPGNVDQAGRAIPNIPETQNYVKSIMGRLQQAKPAAPITYPGASTTPNVTQAGMAGPPQPPGFLSRMASAFDPRTPEGRVNLGAGAGALALGVASGGTSLLPSAIGAFLGAAGAKAGNLTSQPGGPPPLREAATQVATEGLKQAAYDLGGGAATKTIVRAAAPFAKKMTLEGYAALAQMPKMVGKITGVKSAQVLPAQVTESRVLDIAQNIAEGSLLGGGRIKAFKESQEETLSDLVEKTVSRYGSPQSQESAGQAFLKGLEKNTDAFHQAGGALYHQVDQLAQGVKVPTGDLGQFAAQELTRRGALPKSVTGNSAHELLEDFQQWAGTTPTIPFSEAQFLRSQLLRRIRGYTGEKDDVARGIAEQMVARIDSAMDTAAGQLNPQAQAAWRHAGAFWKEGKEKFESKFLRRLAEQHPEKVAQSLMSNRQVTAINKAKAAVSAGAWQKIQSASAHEIMRTAVDDTGRVSGSKLASRLKTMSPATLQAIFPKTHTEITDLARTLNTIQSKQGEGTGRMFVQLAQGGAAMSLMGGMAGGPVGAGAAGIVLGPTLLARIMTTPTGIRWLTTGLRLGPQSPEGQRALAQLMAWSARAATTESSGPPPSRSQGPGPLATQGPPGRPYAPVP